MPLSLTYFADVESSLRMELVLNLAWVLVAAFMFCVWVQRAPRAGGDRRMQLVALAVLLLILFPVISVTDDLQAVQNPAETDCCQRRSHACSAPHCIFSAPSSLPLPAFAGLSFAALRVAVPTGRPALLPDDPALHPIQSRPPPAA
jgi:hypothetical protein